MKRWVLHSLSLFSLALSLTAVIFWIRSHQVDEMHLPPTDTVHVLRGKIWTELASDRGQIHFLRLDGFEVSENGAAAEYPLSTTYRSRDGSSFEASYSSESLLWLTYDPIPGKSARAFPCGSWQRGHVPPPTFSPLQLPPQSEWPTYTLVTVRFQAIVILFSILPAISLMTYVSRRVRRAGRAKRGQYQNCGFDLRATPARCPECGHTPSAP